MSPELDRLGRLGWKAPEPDERGVRWGPSPAGSVSYPQGVLEELSEAGGEGFWLEARADEVGSLLSEARISCIWDVGAGSGAMAKRLPDYGTEVISVEPLPEGAREIAGLGGEIFCGTLEDLQLPSRSVSAVGLFDVLEHLDDPTRLLEEIARVLKPTGKLLVTVPAYQWLWSAEDEALGHYRRYTRASLLQEISGNGLTVLSCRYLFASLVPAALLLRTLPYRITQKSRDARTVLERNAARMNPGGVSSEFARRLLRMESSLAHRIPLPFGLSVLALAQPKEYV